MESSPKNPKSATPVKDPHGFISKLSENSNPNISHSKHTSPLPKSVKSQKSAAKDSVSNQNPVFYSPKKKIRERKFLVAKKNSKKEKVVSNPGVIDCKCKERFGGNVKKCVCLAYETLRASQEEFFKNPNGHHEKAKESEKEEGDDYRAESEVEDEAMEKGFAAQNVENEDGYGSDEKIPSETEQLGSIGSSTIKRRRERLLEEARNSVPEFGKVKHLVNTFEKLRLMPSSQEADNNEKQENKEVKKKAIQWALPGLHCPKLAETEVSSSPFSLPEFESTSGEFCPSNLFLTSENLGLDSRFSISSSWDGSQSSVSGRASNGGRRSRRNSSDSCGTMGARRWKKKQAKVTSQQPFKLRTEQRGKRKEELFTKKIQEMMVEEEKQRIPIAQGLPWTTDEPENLIKPTVKENTRPIDLQLHSDIRAVERAEFDYQVAEKMNLIELYKMERERLQKLAEEEEVRRLRKELVPKAQPMPYFDRPFIPRRSTKHPTVPKEPKFHIPQHKKIKCGLSWSDMSTFTYQQ
ncbi:hypothetical protein K2173_014255 [Erythroxylum novogranatense]|uniref:TPX2 C-terminal domain-containing protein n=1 Tax=Erythroxylum novogranatense TaxID=1862640 RepID=A0AAV8SDU0_9ROSI|nr:hypothetical protein K2173_014255 [Erythroxylum novogranatense]